MKIWLLRDFIQEKYQEYISYFLRISSEYVERERKVERNEAKRKNGEREIIKFMKVRMVNKS